MTAQPPDWFSTALATPVGFGGEQRTYPSREAALARFRLVPEHPVLPYVRDHIAAWSVAPGTTTANGAGSSTDGCSRR